MAYWIGVMSGTSMDGVDAVLVDITESSIQAVGAYHVPYPSKLLTQLHALCSPQHNELNLCGSADRAVAEVFASAVNGLLQQQQVKPHDIVAIGSHGQTIRHYPKQVPGADQDTFGFTLQIGDPNTLAVQTGIDVISDFRRKDIALGGQGAPLAPAYHRVQFHHPEQQCVVLNIGGFANISLIPANPSHDMIGYDTGPGNTLMDAWCLLHKHQPYDKDGEWASSGKESKDLLTRMLADPYFTATGPKSTGREYFNLPWLTQHLRHFPHLPANDVQATLLSFTAHTVARAIDSHANVSACYVCGGGAFNGALMQKLRSLLAHIHVDSTQALGINPQWVEAIAFAWLAWAYKQGKVGNVPSVTGAQRGAVLGTLTTAN